MSGGGCEQRLEVAAYVLGALDSGEHERFERHLKSCATCQADVKSLQPTADVLAHDVTHETLPRPLRDRIMVQVRSEAELLAAAGAGADRPTRAPRDRRRTRRVTAFATALVAACGVAAGLVISGGGVTAHPQTIQALVVPRGARAQLVRTGSRAELVVTGLPQPPSGHIYQVWLAHAKGDPQPTDALFSVSRTGSGSTDVPGNLHGVRRVMVTAEPLGGSKRPTSTPIIVATI